MTRGHDRRMGDRHPPKKEERTKTSGRSAKERRGVVFPATLYTFSFLDSGTSLSLGGWKLTQNGVGLWATDGKRVFARQSQEGKNEKMSKAT